MPKTDHQSGASAPEVRLSSRSQILRIAALLLAAALLPRAFAQTFDDALGRAQSAQSAGQYTAAATAYAEATTLDPSIPELWANRGLMEHLAGQPAAAIRSFQHALAARPTLFTALLFTGIDHVALNQSRQAIPFLERALRLQPANPDALIALGKAFTADDRLSQAATTLEHAVTSSPASSSAWFSLATTRLALIDRDGSRLAKDHAGTAWAQALYAEELLIQGRVNEALDAFRQAAAAATPSQRTLFAAVLTARRSSEAAQQQANASPAPSGASTAPPSTQAGAVAAPTLAIDRALAILQPSGSSPAAPCPSPAQNPPLARTSAACSYLQGDAQAAAAVAAATLAREPANPEALFWSVKSNEQLSVAALATFERLAPQSAATFDLMGDLYRRRLQPDRALAEYDRALAADPHDPAALLGTAAAFLTTGRPDQAVTTAQTALADRPDNPRLNLLMGEALAAQHKFSDARPFAERSLSVASQPATGSSYAALLPSAHALLGQIKADAGDIPGAIADLTLGLPSETDGSLSFQLSRLYRRRGQTEPAMQAEARARSLLASRRARAITAVNTSVDIPTATPVDTPAATPADTAP